MVSQLWNAYYAAVDAWLSPWLTAHPAVGYPPEGTEAFAVAVIILELVVGIDLWLALLVLRSRTPRWRVWAALKTRFGRVALAVVPTVAFFVILELAICGFVASKPQPMWMPHPLYFWRLTPNTTCYVFHENIPIQVNRSGFRGIDVPYAKESNEFRIVICGDSVTFGQGVTLDDTAAAVLERMLAARYPSKKITVVNAGTCGYSISQSYYLFEEEGRKYDPDLLIVANHKWRVTRDHLARRETIAKNPILRRLHAFGYHFVTYITLRKVIARINHDNVDLVSEKFDNPQEDDNGYSEYCIRFLDYCRSAGIPSIFVAPLPPHADNRDAWHTIGVLEPFVAQLRPTDRVFLMEWMLDAPADKFTLPNDRGHLSPLGNASIARQYFEVIVNNRLVE